MFWDMQKCQHEHNCKQFAWQLALATLGASQNVSTLFLPRVLLPLQDTGQAQVKDELLVETRRQINDQLIQKDRDTLITANTQMHEFVPIL